MSSMRPAALVLLLLTLAPACRGEPAPRPTTAGPGVTETTPGADAGANRPPQLALPPATPLVTTALGEEAWRVVAVSPSRDALAVATAEHVFLLSLPTRTERWRRPIERPATFLAFARDGARLAVLGRTEDAQERLIELATADGATLADRTFAGLRTSSSGRGGDREPPAWPTGLMPAMSGDGFWITNAYGAHLAAPGQATLAPVPDPPAGGRLTAAQDGLSYWTTADKALVRVDDPSVRVALPCYAQRFVIDPGLGRAVTTCWEQGKAPELHVVELATGRLVARVESGNDLAQAAILAPERVVVIAAAPSRVAWIDLADTAGTIRWHAQAQGWDGIEHAPDGSRVLGVGGGAIQILDATTGKILCDHVGLAAAGTVIAAGFVDPATVWTLALRPDVFNALQVARVTLSETGACTVDAPRHLGIGKTTNLAPRWVPGRPGFVLNALLGDGYGLALVDLAGPEPRIDPLAPSSTPAFVVGDDGVSIAAVDHQSASVWRAGAPSKVTAGFGEVARLVPCGERLMVYRWNRGWTVTDPSGQRELARFDTPQPEEVACRGATLVVASHNQLVVVDLAASSPRATHTFTLDRRPGTMALARDGASLWLAGGGTGWRRLALGPAPR